jgi:mannosyltransferase
MFRVNSRRSIFEISRVRFLLAAAGILGLAFLLRVWNLNAESAWIDEAYSIGLARHSALEIIQGTAADQHPPLYYLILGLWLQFGVTVFSARFLSVILGIIQVALLMWWGKQLRSPAVGLVAGLLFAFLPMHVWYSQEARMYILLALLTTASTVELERCLRSKGRWGVYALWVGLALYTHYFAVFVMLAHAFLILLWALRTRERKWLWTWFVVEFVVVLFFAPWLPTVINQMRFHKMIWISAPDVLGLRDTVLTLLVGQGVSLLPSEARWVGLAIILGLLGISLAWVIRRWHSAKAWRWGMVLAWGIIPFLAITLVSLNYPVFQTKQFLILTAPLVLWLALLASILPRPAGVTLGASVLLLSVFFLFRQQSVLTKQDWRGAASFVQAGFRDGDMVYGNPAAAWLGLSLYWDHPLEFDGYPSQYDIVTGGWEGNPITPAVADQVLQRIRQEHRRIWLVESYPQFWDPEGAVENWLSRNARPSADRQFRDVRVRVFEFSQAAR